MNKLKTNIIRFFSVYILLLTFIGICLSHYFGMAGYTKKFSEEGSPYYGCNCHGDMIPTPTLKVWVAGPESVEVGTITNYRIKIQGGPALYGGFNVSVLRGTLIADTLTNLILPENALPPYEQNDYELTHSEPKQFNGDTVSWEFRYKAPNTIGTDTIFSVGNSADGDGTTYGDVYNFGNNFIIKIVQPQMVNEFNTIPKNFQLKQNYPNPFNSSTIISFSLSHGEMIDLSVYDINGKLINTLTRGYYHPDNYKINFEANDLTSGIYFYKLQTNDKSLVKKLILLR